MTIAINEHQLDCEIQNEQNIGEILTALEQELRTNGQTITGVTVNGTDDNNGEKFEELAALPIAADTDLRVETQPVIVLYAQALDYYKSSTEPDGRNKWRQYIASFNEKTAADLAVMETKAPEQIPQYLAELMELLSSPESALRNNLQQITALIPEMENIAVLFQTGKDSQVMNIISDFSKISGRFIQIAEIFQLLGNGHFPETIGGTAIADFLNNYNTVLNDFLTALSEKDTVLSGDLAEYEIVPRLADITSAFSDYCK